MFFLSFTFGKAQELVQDNTDSVYAKTFQNAQKIDSALFSGYETDNRLYPKTFRENFRKHYQTDDFNYTPSKPKTTGWDRLMAKIAEWLANLFNDVDGRETLSVTGIILKIVGFAVLGFVLYIVISYFISENGNFIFRKKPKTITVEAEDIVENIHEINFQEKILGCENQGDYRSAVRYRFLNVLKKLSDQKKIEWNAEKTNHDYLRELKSAQAKTDFAELIYIFEYIWYGEFEINEEVYHQIKPKFEVKIQ